MIPANSDLNINRYIYLTSCIERKASVDEICVNLEKNERTHFENDLIRAKGNPFMLLVEDQNGYFNILDGRYRSKYNPLALLATIKTFEARYGFTTYFTDKIFSGNYINHYFYYHFLRLPLNSMINRLRVLTLMKYDKAVEMLIFILKNQTTIKVSKLMKYYRRLIFQCIKVKMLKLNT